MIAELFHYLTTPCSWRMRKWGYLSESIGISSRYRRCQKEWQPHLSRTQEKIVQFLQAHPELRSVLFCGSGAGLDIPWSSRELQRFERIVLVDLIHPWSIRWKGVKDSRMELHSVDLSGVIEGVEKGGIFPEPVIDWSPKFDLVVSLNLLSQLPIVPLEQMERRLPTASEKELTRWAQRIQQSHLEKISEWGKFQLVISDIQEIWLNRAGEIVERQDPWYGAHWFDPEEEWEWRISPLGESDSQRSKIHRVGVSSLSGRLKLSEIKGHSELGN